MTRCNQPSCRRKRAVGYAFCTGHVRALVARVFGKSADYPVAA